MSLKKHIASIDPSMIANRDELRAASYTANGMVTVDFEDILIRVDAKGNKFNRRTTFRNIEELADSIASEGLQEPLKVDVLSDGRIFLNDGERRFKAIQLVRSRTPEDAKRFSKVKVLVNDKDMTDTDRLIQQITSNSGEPFDIMDEAEAFKELRDGGIDGTKLTTTEIATRTGKSVPYVDGRLRLADSTEEEKNLVITGMVKPTALVALLRKEPDSKKRVARIQEANGKGKRFKVNNALHAPGVELCSEAYAQIDDILNNHGITGEPMNILLDVQSKLNQIKQIIQ